MAYVDTRNVVDMALGYEHGKISYNAQYAHTLFVTSDSIEHDTVNTAITHVGFPHHALQRR